MKRLYVIGGTMGVGKTTVCRRLARRLPNSAFLDGDYAYPLKLYQALLKAYGEAEPVTGAQSFGEATEASLEAMKQSERCVGRWEKEDYVIEISFYVGTSAAGERLDSISLDIRIPDELLDLPTISPDGEIIG